MQSLNEKIRALESQRDAINAKLDAEMAISAGLREELEEAHRTFAACKDGKAALEMALERDAAIAERDKLRYSQEENAKRLTYERNESDATARSAIYSAEAATRRAEKYCIELGDMQTQRDAAIAERYALREEVSGWDEERDSARMAADELKRLRAQIAAATSPEGIARANAALRDCNIWSMGERPLFAAIAAALEVTP